MKYVVLNPRQIPKGICVLAVGREEDGDRREWHEGDTYDGPNPTGLVDRGFLRKVGASRG